MRFLLSSVVLAAVIPALVAQTSPIDLLEQKTLAQIRQFDATFDGLLGVAALDLTTGRTFAYHGDTVFVQGSLIKVPILAQVFQAERLGRLRFSDPVTLAAADIADGSGSLQNQIRKSGNVATTIAELARVMIVDSDNTATNRLIDLAGMEEVNRMLERLGLRQTRLRRKMMDAAAVARDDENLSTPLEMVRLMELIDRGDVIDRKACDAMLAILKQVKAAMRSAVPPAYEVAAKPGRVEGVACEAGIVYLERRPFALSVMSTFHGARAGNPVADVTRVVYGHFERLAHSNRYGERFAPRP